MPFRTALRFASRAVIVSFFASAILSLSCLASAQQGAPAGSPVKAPAAGAARVKAARSSVRGTVADPDSAVVPGATVTFTPAQGTPIIVKSASDGTYVAEGLAPGVYSLTVTMNGFASYVKMGVRVDAGQSLTMDARLAIQQQNQQVNVTANTNTLSVDSDSNASSTVIKGKDLDALSDDPDELSSELSALAGPAAGPNGGQIYIDGFTGGQLPPKSSIREIRINQNPFSAQYDRQGYGRVEVFTKPGTDKFHGFFQGGGNANFLNTSNPLLNGVPQEPYHTIFLLGNLTGPISSKASFSLGGSHRSIQDNSIFAGTLLADSASATAPCAPGTAADPSPCAPYATSIPLLFPQVRTDINPRIDYQLAEKNTLTVRYEYEINSQKNAGVDNLTLPSTAYNLDSTENTIQLVDSQILSSRLINETRFEYSRDKSSQSPLSRAPTLSVEGAFTSGGASAQTVDDHQDHFEVQNYTSLALAKHFIRFGGRLRTTRDANYSDAQSEGIFTYSCLQPDVLTNCTAAYSTGQASQYTVSQINQGSVHATLADLGVYAEDDWKPRANLNFSYGLRYETQNHIRDHHDFAPRLSFAWGVGTAKGTPQTVIRGGFGVFYDRFSLSNVITTEQQNGVNQQLYVVRNPDAINPACSPDDQAACLAGAAAAQTTYALAPSLRSSYTMQTAIGVDEQLGKVGTVSINYINSRGVHEFNSQNLNAPIGGPDGVYPIAPPVSGVAPNFYQFASDGVFRQNQLTIAPRINYRRSVSMWGYYSLGFAKADSSGSGSFPSVPGDLGADYGRASFDTRQRLFTGGSFTLPHRVTLSPFLIAASGTPFNIVTGTDLNGDSILNNDRPAFCSATTVNPIQNAHGCFDVTPSATAPRIPVNYGSGPPLFTMNMRITKAFGFGESTASKAAQSGNTPGGGPPGGGGPPRGGGGGGRGGPGGGFFGGGGSSGKKYTINIGLQTFDLFNNADRGVPSGVVGSPKFYQSTSLAGNPYTSNSALRRINLQASFSF